MLILIAMMLNPFSDSLLFSLRITIKSIAFINQARTATHEH